MYKERVEVLRESRVIDQVEHELAAIVFCLEGAVVFGEGVGDVGAHLVAHATQRLDLVDGRATLGGHPAITVRGVAAQAIELSEGLDRREVALRLELQ